MSTAHGSAGGQATYSHLFTTLTALGKNLKKNKNKALDQTIEELKQLLTLAKVDSMNSSSASARVAEAQILVSQATAYKLQANRLAEAQCYLTASALWFDVEVERRNNNFPTLDDALCKAVMCGAIACGILLAQRPTPQSSPASRRFSTAPIPLPASRYLTKCWGICYQLASRLYYDFGCMEMAADYFEIAAQVVSAKPSASHVQVPPPVQRAGGAVGSGAQSVSGSTQSPKPRSVATAPQPVAASGKSSFAVAMEKQPNSASNRRQEIPAAGDASHQSSEPLTAANRDADVGSAEGPAISGGAQGNADDVTSLTSNAYPHSAFLVTGHFLLYLTAMRAAIITAAVLKDYPRARSLSEDVFHHWHSVQAARRGIGVQPNEAARGEATAAAAELSASVAYPEAQDFSSPSLAVDGSVDVMSDPDATPQPSFAGGAPERASTVGASTARLVREATLDGTAVFQHSLPSVLNPTQLLAAMLQEEEVLVHLHVVRFFIPLLLKESPVVAQRALHELQDLAQLHAELESKCPQWRRPLRPSSGAARPSGANQSRPSFCLDAAPLGRRQPTNGENGRGRVRALAFSQALNELAGTLEIILDAYTNLATSSSPGEYEEVLEAAVDDFGRLMSATSHAVPGAGTTLAGVHHRCRELNILSCRVKELIVTVPYDLIGSAEGEERSAHPPT